MMKITENNTECLNTLKNGQKMMFTKLKNST